MSFFNSYTCFDDSFSLLYDDKWAKLCTSLLKYRSLVDIEHVGIIRSPRVGAKRCLYYVLCL